LEVIISREPIRKNPYAQSTNRRSLWLARLALLFIVVLVVGTASWLLIGRIQAAFQGGVVIGEGNPNLSTAERLYLQAYLARHAGELQQAYGPFDAVTFFVVAPGETANIIASNLQAAGLISDPELFVNYVHYYGLDNQLKAGEFQFNGRVTIPDLVLNLTNAVTRDIQLRFIEGWRLEEMANYLAVTTPGQLDADDFLAIARRETRFDLAPYNLSLPDAATLEGYLFPDTYGVPADADTRYLVDAMLQNFNQRVTPAMRQGFGLQGLSLHEAVTLASIVEREAVIEEERPLIARVFLNRLAQGMRLQADPTTQYALGYQANTNSWWKSGLTLADLQYQSPYNTYFAEGLPPGPIANPGLSSLQAVAEPATAAYLFFVADCTAGQAGRHLFSTTFAEHEAYVAQCQ
jgi:UPF0755 protein